MNQNAFMGNRFGSTATYFLADCRSLIHIVQLGQKDKHFIATHSANRVAGPHTIAYSPRHCAQH